MPPVPTKAVAVRLTVEQLDAAKNLPEDISLSLLVRALLQEFFTGKLPHIIPQILAEKKRTKESVQTSYDVLTKINERRKAECQLKKTPLPLRFPLRNLELDQEP